tara:strand:- start:54 stop:1106 length:1053 start_codon:yes stop_codon:yes gene_type:complete
MDPDNINDIRQDFKNITFSKFQKSQAKIELINTIYNCKIENACYWCAEFICAGHFLDLWDIIIIYFCKYIHSGNPKLPIYLSMRYNSFLTILNNGYSSNLMMLRNNKKIRKLFAEIICILSFSVKKHNYQQVKLNKNEEFDLTNISSRFKAPNIHYIDNILKDDDPKELLIPLNELIFNLENKNIIDTCYWFEWILEYENICKKKKKKCLCQGRTYAPNNNQNDIIWILWDTIFYYSNVENNKNKENINIINKIVKSLYELFIIRYNPPIKKKRKFIIYFCFSLIIENYNFESPLTNKNQEIEAIVSKIDTIYKEIKKNEISPNTDYLFTNLKKSNLEKTIEKIEMINNI